jgi:hypothetical protein
VLLEPAITCIITSTGVQCAALHPRIYHSPEGLNERTLWASPPRRWSCHSYPVWGLSCSRPTPHTAHTHTHQSSGGGSALSSWAREFARRAVKIEVCAGCGCLVDELESANKKWRNANAAGAQFGRVRGQGARAPSASARGAMQKPQYHDTAGEWKLSEYEVQRTPHTTITDNRVVTLPMQVRTPPSSPLSPFTFPACPQPNDASHPSVTR